MRRDWTKANEQLRDENIRIAEERGRHDLKNDDKKSTKITASEVNKYKRRKKKWSNKPTQKS